tara:strand:- start:242 stop:604 length:363 start_codon:yes stop_codon:yes gene_type:complete
MSRYTAVYRNHQLLAEYSDGVLTWSKDGGFEQDNCSGPQVIRDIGPYKSMIDGSIIDGRKRHRDHLRAHGCVEVGNEPMVSKQKPITKTNRNESLHRMLGDCSDRDVQRMVKREIESRRQ